MKETVLIVDDDPSLLNMVERVVASEGFRVLTAPTGAKAIAAVDSGTPDLVLLDLKLPDASGVDLLARFRKDRPDLPVLIMTTDTNLERAVECMRLGAVDYIQKPFDRTRLITSVRSACSMGILTTRVRTLTTELRGGDGFSTLLGESRALKSAIELLSRVAPLDVTVLLQGESGTGKEVAARALHAESPRRSAPFVAVNCGAIPEGIIESELFGHEKGAFTGAVEPKAGFFEQARDGTLFLDEIGELHIELQVRLLRVLQERTVKRLGGRVERPVDVRVIAASNRDLKEEVERGRMRQDLYYRLAVFPCVLPPLRERGDDVVLLAEAFVASFGARHDRSIKGLSPPALQALKKHSWPGNVRELANAIERAVILEDSSFLSLASLPDAVVDSLGPDGLKVSVSARSAPCATSSATCLGGREWARPADIVPLEIAEEQMIRRALELTGGNIQESARLLGVGRTTMYRKIERYGLRPDEPASREDPAD